MNIKDNTDQSNWLTTKLRPDITYALARLQHQNAAPDMIDKKLFER
jgi:hypothetical protein